MKKVYTTALSLCLLMVLTSVKPVMACYANFSHTNACVGDTVWFYGLDFSAVHTWDFGDTTANNPNIAFDDTSYHVYTSTGTYYVTHFVNIGAEWAFETQEVTVGTICFMADFSTRCGSSLYVTYQNNSIGNNLSYSWNFGEPSSGTDDTSSSFGPYHFYGAPGNYAVTLIINDGTLSDTSVQIITVDSACMSTFISYQWNPCVGDTTHFYYNFTGVTAVYWDFGDPASGINNYSTLMSPTHIFALPGVYIGMVIYSNGINTDTIPVVTRVVDCSVWPGDANRDGYVTGEDFLAVALYYGDTGVVRNNATSSFIAQPATNWVSSFNWAYMYLQDLVDKKHADCNGDGIVNAADAALIAQNFGMSHQTSNTFSSMMVTNPSDPHLSLSLPASVSGLSTIVADLTYGDSIVHTPVYGFCVYIDYNPLQIDQNAISVDFTGSFLDTINISNLITYFYNDVVNHRIVVVAARTDHNGMSGFGHLAAISFNAYPGYSGTLELHIGSDTKVMSNSVFTGSTFGNVQNFFKVNTDDAGTQVSLSVIEQYNDKIVAIYPAPAMNYFHLDVKNVSGNYSVRILDATGRILSVKYPVTNRQLIDIQDLSAGFYFVQIHGSGWEYNSRIVIEK